MTLIVVLSDANTEFSPAAPEQDRQYNRLQVSNIHILQKELAKPPHPQKLTTRKQSVR